METIHIVLDKKLLQAADQAARRSKKNRSALVREALREHLQRLDLRAREERDRVGYSRKPHVSGESVLVGGGRCLAGRIALGDVRL